MAFPNKELCGRAEENQRIGRLEAGRETIQSVDLTLRPWWDHSHLRGCSRDREQHPWPGRMSHPRGNQKDRGWPWTSFSHYHQCQDPLSTSPKPRHPWKRKKEKRDEKRHVLTEPLTKWKLSFKSKVSYLELTRSTSRWGPISYGEFCYFFNGIA